MLYIFLTFLAVSYSQQSCKVSGGDDCLTATSCPNDQICEQTTMKCVNGASLCGTDGSCELCGVNGMITAACGSAGSPSCGSGADNADLLGCGAGETTWNAKCDYASLVPKSGYNLTVFEVGQAGDHLSCFDISGSVLVGTCGSTDIAKCYSYDSASYGIFGIQCASINQYEMEWDASVWVNATFAQTIQCPPGFVGTGRCGSGSSAACDVDTNTFHALQCTPFAYPSRRRRRN
jgi:hypothetical protein